MEELARLRELKGFSQRALAKESGVSPATIYELENGRRRANPSTLRKIATALDVEVADLLGDEYPKAPALPLELDAEDEMAAHSDTDVLYETVYTPDNLEDAISRTFEEVHKALGDVDTKGRRLSILHRDDGSVEVRVEPMSRRSSRVRSSSGKTVKVRRGQETA